jgi:hypothetical protein
MPKAAFGAFAALCFGFCATAQQTNSVSSNSSPSRLDYSSFKIVTERNIFNANRSGRVARTREQQRQVKVDTFALVGTLSYEKGTFAFFDGSSSQYRKTAKVADSVAGFKVAAIGQSTAQLEADGKKIEMRVGSQMRREDEGEWKLEANAQPFASASSDRSSSQSSGSDAGKSSGPANEDDVLKRLMQQREKE